MKKHTLAAAIVAACACVGGAAAGTIDDELAAIKARLQQLEQQVQAQNEVIQEKDRQIRELVSNSSVRERQGSEGDGWFDNVEVGGVIEIEAGYNDPYTGDSTSDIVVATAELAVAAQINGWVAGEIILLYEEDDTPLEVDVATITVAPPDGPWSFTGGQLYVPFGTYETNLVSDPLTLEIGETRESAALAGFASGGFGGAVYLFNGDNKKGGDDEADNFGATVGYGREGENGGFEVNIGYINDIGDSDGLQDAINGNLGSNNVTDHVAGFTVDAMWQGGPFNLIGEYTAALDEFQAAELPWQTRGAEPSAYNIEAGYAFTLGGRDAVVAVAYQGTEEAVALELPETRIAIAIGVDVMDATTLSFEWAHDDDYPVADGGTGEEADTLTAQLTVEY